ncbi:unnamed protein product, partial [Ectocarpus fasciculatus]
TRTITRDKPAFGKTTDPFNKTAAGVSPAAAASAAGGGGAVAPSGASNFFIMCTGQVEFGEFGSLDNLYCRYTLSFGNDWYIVHGLDTGLSQIAQRAGGQDTSVVWNFPIDVTFKSTNAFGWPRIALSVFRVDDMGRDTVVGYGSVLIPTQAGRHERVAHMYAPQPSSMLQRFRAWVSGAYPEFFDSKFVTRGEGREVTRVRRSGTVKVSLDVMTRGMADFGYNRPEGMHGVGQDQRFESYSGAGSSSHRVSSSIFGNTTGSKTSFVG